MNQPPDFNRLARCYRWMEFLSFGPWLSLTRRTFLDKLSNSRHALVLGDGDGRFTSRLLRANPTVHVDAVDASAAMLQTLLRRAGPHANRVRVHLADARIWAPPVPASAQPYQPVVKVDKTENHPPGAKQAAEKLRISGDIGEELPSGAKALVDSAALTARLKPCPFKATGFSAACNARHFLSAICGTAEAVPFQDMTFSTGCYDLIATHFFLDCLTQPEVQSLAAMLRSAAAPSALWIVSEFAVPPGWFGSFFARPLVSGLYLAFGWLTGLAVCSLPDHAAALRSAGFTIEERRSRLGGLLIAELWSSGAPDRP